MMDKTNKEHWNNIYANKQSNELSWTQENPETSLNFINSFNLPKQASIIDIGGGDSRLVDKLIDEGYMDITVLDISEHALIRAKKRLGNKANSINWVVSDITEYKTEKTFDLWHDRATFHFMTTLDQISAYLKTLKKNLNKNGFLILGTFSENGPKKCSGLDIKQYSKKTLQKLLQKEFKKLKCITEDHQTPFNTLQNFIFCSFKRIST